MAHCAAKIGPSSKRTWTCARDAGAISSSRASRARGQADARRASRHVGEELDVVRAERVVLEVVLDGPEGVEPELFGEHAELDLLGDHLPVAHSVGVAERLEDHLHAELHR